MIRQRNYSWLGTITDRRELYGYCRWLSKNDLYFLCKFVLGMADLETQSAIHYGLCEHLETNDPRRLVLMSRDTFKTSVAIGKVVQWIINDRNVEVGIGSDRSERAEDRTKMVKATFEHCKPLRYLFPEVCYKDPLAESDKWTESEFNVKRDPYVAGTRMPTVSSFGLFPLPTGAHFSKGLIDDVENETNTNTEELVLGLNQRLTALLPVLKADAQLFMVGTIYHEKGPNNVFSGLWPTYKVPIIDRHGRPTFPSRFPLDVIKAKRAEIIRLSGEYTWSTQYLLKPHPRDHNYFYPMKDVQLQSFRLART